VFLPFPSVPEFPDKDPRECLRLARAYLQEVFDYVSPVSLLSSILAAIVGVFLFAWLLFGLDETVSWLSDGVPLALAVIGAVLSIKKLREQHQFVIIPTLVAIGVLGTIVLHTSRVQLERKVSAVQTLLNNVSTRQEQQDKGAVTLETARSHRIENLKDILRAEYILSHSKISPGLLAGTEIPPTEWMNEKLKERGESFRITSFHSSPLPKPVPPPPTPEQALHAMTNRQLRDYTINFANQLRDLVSKYDFGAPLHMLPGMTRQDLQNQFLQNEQNYRNQQRELAREFGQKYWGTANSLREELIARLKAAGIEPPVLELGIQADANWILDEGRFLSSLPDAGAYLELLARNLP
jgi:hypothetical protein